MNFTTVTSQTATSAAGADAPACGVCDSKCIEHKQANPDEKNSSELRGKGSLSSKPVIGIVGGFEFGKSTLINCLLEDNVAVTGNHTATTSHSVYYVYGAQMQFFRCMTDGKECEISQSDFLQTSQHAGEQKEEECDHFKVQLPHPLLEKITIVDTPGFDNDEDDDETTMQKLENFSFVLLIAPERHVQGEAFRNIARRLHEKSRPFGIVINCVYISNPLSEMAIQINRNVVHSMQNFHMWSLGATRILNANFMWYWYSICRRKNFPIDSEDDEDGKYATLENAAYLLKSCSSQDAERKSNIQPLLDFLYNRGTSIQNVETYHKMQQAFQSYQDAVLKKIEIIRLHI